MTTARVVFFKECKRFALGEAKGLGVFDMETARITTHLPALVVQAVTDAIAGVPPCSGPTVSDKFLIGL